LINKKNGLTLSASEVLIIPIITNKQARLTAKLHLFLNNFRNLSGFRNKNTVTVLYMSYTVFVNTVFYLIKKNHI